MSSEYFESSSQYFKISEVANGNLLIVAPLLPVLYHRGFGWQGEDGGQLDGVSGSFDLITVLTGPLFIYLTFANAAITTSFIRRTFMMLSYTFMGLSLDN